MPKGVETRRDDGEKIKSQSSLIRGLRARQKWFIIDRGGSESELITAFYWIREKRGGFAVFKIMEKDPDNGGAVGFRRYFLQTGFLLNFPSGGVEGTS